ncbi:MAG TPA: hypothetical protein VK789_34425 [Bryobacteraceae bacterium]|jgi:hypothetical protein|nr:hypothetical protein [Bryobacteraceae bacterium]
MTPWANTFRVLHSFLGAEFPVVAIAALAITAGVRPAIADLSFQNIVNPGDPTFNQELGINNAGLITGYFGSGTAGHPNQGYTTVPPYNGFTNENFPGSVQTQVTGLNNVGTTVGFWSDTNLGIGLDSNFGFVDLGGTFTSVNDPGTATTPPVFNQLLGVNDGNIAVGFYTDAAGNTHGYTYNIAANTFSANIDDPLANGSTTAAAINNAGEIAGFYTNASGATVGFLDNGGSFEPVTAPGAVDTSLLGLNNKGEAVGFDIDGAGNMHGIICNTATLACVQADDPNGIGTTTFNGVNDNGQIVGFYVNGDGNTIGVAANPTPEPGYFLVLFGALTGLVIIRFRRRASAAS